MIEPTEDEAHIEARMSAAVRNIHNKRMRLEIAGLVEALALAEELIPTGGGAGDGISCGFEATTPGALHEQSAKTWRIARQALAAAGREGRKLLRMAHGIKRSYAPVGVSVEPGVSEPSSDLVHRARELRENGIAEEEAILHLVEEFGVPTVLLGEWLERGATIVGGTPTNSRMLFLAVHYTSER